VEFAGQKIANIYDYTYALDAVKIGQPVEIVVMRDGQRPAIKATPNPEIKKAAGEPSALDRDWITACSRRNCR